MSELLSLNDLNARGAGGIIAAYYGDRESGREMPELVGKWANSTSNRWHKVRRAVSLRTRGDRMTGACGATFYAIGGLVDTQPRSACARCLGIK